MQKTKSSLGGWAGGFANSRKNSFLTEGKRGSKLRGGKARRTRHKEKRIAGMGELKKRQYSTDHGGKD